jgi:hypothetical protein
LNASKVVFSDARYGHAAAAEQQPQGRPAASRSNGKKVSQFHNFVNVALK